MSQNHGVQTPKYKTIPIFLKGVIKYDLSDNLPNFFLISTWKSPQNASPLKTIKRFLNENELAFFKDQINNINWDSINSTQYSSNGLCETFLNIFNGIYDANYPLTETKIKPKSLITSWLSNALKKIPKLSKSYIGICIYIYIYI